MLFLHAFHKAFGEYKRCREVQSDRVLEFLNWNVPFGFGSAGRNSKHEDQDNPQDVGNSLAVSCVDNKMSTGLPCVFVTSSHNLTQLSVDERSA
jgi:hypothetical protein